MKNIIQVIVLNTMCLSTIYSCNRHNDCPEKHEETIYLTQNAIDKIPYSGFDTLYFLGQNEDTNILRGTGKHFFFDLKTISGNSDCLTSEYIYYQGYKIEFIPIKGTLGFSVNSNSLQNAFVISPNGAINNNVGFYFEHSRLNDTSKFYGGIPIKDGVSIKDTCYACSYTLNQGITNIKDCSSNSLYLIIK